MKKKLVISALITACLSPAVKSFAHTHRTQFNASVVGLLFCTVLAALIFIAFAGDFWTACDACKVDEDVHRR